MEKKSKKEVLFSYFSLSQIAGDLVKKVINLTMIAALYTLAVVISVSLLRYIYNQAVPFDYRYVYSFIIVFLWKAVSYSHQEHGAQGFVYIYKKNCIYYKLEGTNKILFSTFKNEEGVVNWKRKHHEGLYSFVPQKIIRFPVKVDGLLKNYYLELKENVFFNQVLSEELFVISCRNKICITVDDLYDALERNNRCFLDESIEYFLKSLKLDFENEKEFFKEVEKKFPELKKLYDWR